MGQLEVTDAFKRGWPKKGEAPRNPTGKNGDTFQRRRAADIKKDLYAILTEPSGMPGFENISRYEYGLRNVVAQFMVGERWAVKFITDRVWGRVPFEIDLRQPPENLSRTPDSELLDRVERLREMLTASIANTIEAKVVDQK